MFHAISMDITMDKMNFSHNMIRAVVVAVILAQPGCSYTKLMTTRFENPTFAFTGSVLVETSQNGAIVNFLFIAHNPNEAGLKNITCSYELFVEGKKFATGKDFTLALDPKGDTQITVPATIVYADLYPALGSVVRRILSGQKTIPITIDALFRETSDLCRNGKETPIFSKIGKTAEILCSGREEIKTMKQFEV
jgi:hypothetical protein